MRTRFLLSLAVIAGAMLATSCKKDVDDGGKNGGKTGGTAGVVEHLDITDAAYLYTTSGPGGSARSTRNSGGSARLFKVLANGNSEEVEITDGEGNPVVADQIFVEQLTDDIIRLTLITGSWYSGYEFEWFNEYFARKSDGAVFAVPETLCDKDVWELSQRMHIQTDKYNNIYCAGYYVASNVNGERTYEPKGIYKIATTGGEMTATPIVSDVLIYNGWHSVPFVVDRLGNILYGNSYGNHYCIPTNGEKFRIDNIVFSSLIPMIDDTNGGFLNTGGAFVTVDTNQQRLETTPAANWPTYDMAGEPMILPLDLLHRSPDKIILKTNRTVITTPPDNGGEPVSTRGVVEKNVLVIIKSTTDIAIYDDIKIPHDSDSWYVTYNTTFLSDGIYWRGENVADKVEHQPVSAMKFDYQSGTVSVAYQYTPQSNWDYTGFSFADGVIMYYAIDNYNEKRYRCEVRNGNYTQTDITAEDDTLPTVINFVRVN